MKKLLISILLLAAIAEFGFASPAAQRRRGGSGGGGGQQNQEPMPPMPYDFDVRVNEADADPDGIFIRHTEQAADSNPGRVEGMYKVCLPDGRLKVVTYYVEGDSGFVPEVEYEDDCGNFAS